MAYASTNFKTKKAFKEAVKAGRNIYLWSPGPFAPAENGSEVVEGPWYPQPHRWYASVKVRNGIIEEVK